MAKRTGLGRGIGALIPTGTEAKERPADVFFSRTVSPLPVPAAEEPALNRIRSSPRCPGST
jgi:ParB family chromosome partitioning protein